MEKYMQRVLEEKGHTIYTEYNGQSFDWEIKCELTRYLEEVYYIKEKSTDICLSENVYVSSYNALKEIRSMILDNDSLTFMFWDNDLLDDLDWRELYHELNLIFLHESEEEISQDMACDICIPDHLETK